MQIGLSISPTANNGPIVPFSPATISGLQLWLDASDASMLFTDSAGTTPATADGDPIGRWADKSGNANHVTQSDGTKKPQLKLVIQNGKNVLRSDGVNDILFGDLSPSSSNRTIFIVGKRSSTSASWRGAINLNADDINDTLGNKMYAVYAAGNETNQMFSGRSASTFEFYYAGSGTSYFLISQTNTLTGSSARQNGISVGSISHASQSIGFGVQVRVFNGRIVSAESWLGDIAEIAIYDSVLSAGNISLVESYLNAKWSIY